MRAMLTPGLICVLAGSSLATGPTFAPGTDPAYVNYVRSLYFRQHPGERYNIGTAWTLDTRRSVTFSFVEDGTTIPAQAGIPGDVDGTSVLFQQMDTLFSDGNNATNDRADWQALFAEAFDDWGRASGRSGVNFEFRRRQTPVDPEDDPAFDNWDTGGAWDTTVGPLGGVTTVLVGDVRIGMRNIDGPGGIVAYALPPGVDGDSGNIILDSSENWADSGSSFRFFDNAVGRAIGTAIGMLDVCPENNTKLMEPVISSFPFNGPQFDDIRGVNALYGDRLEPATGDALTLAGSTLVTSDITYTALSITGANEVDYFRISVTSDSAPENITITADPTGGTYSSGTLDASGCTAASLNASSQQNLEIAVFDSSGNPVTVGGYIDDAAIGETEEIIATISTEGTYYIAVRGVDGGATASQMYSLTIDRETSVEMTGVAFGPQVLRGNHADAITQFVDSFVSANPETGLLSAGPLGLSTGTPGPVGHSAQFVRDDGYDGTGARYATVESQHPSDSHLAFFGRPTAKVNWAGVQPAITSTGNHPTAVGAAAAGEFIAGGNPDEFFEGVAPGADLYSATVATFLYGNGSFITGNAAIYYALYSLCSPNYAAAAGLDGPVTVMNNSWGGLGDFRGDGFTAQAYDAVAGTFNTTIVVAAGNDGRIDNSNACGPGGEIPGGEFKGARTIGSPATAFNVISVGAVGRADHVPMPPEDDDGGDDGGKNPGGGGGGGPGDPGGGGGQPQPLADDERPLVAIPAFSSKGPVDTFDFDGFDTEVGARSGVHIVAVGVGDVTWSVANDDPSFPQDPCQWTSNVNASGVALPSFNSLDDTSFSPTQGTSFSAPTVAGAVALLQDVGLSNGYSIDPLVMKSVLLTGAVKLPGWSNAGQPASPQDRRDGRDLDADDLIVPVTQQPLDFAQGAGLLNLRRSYEIYHKGITATELGRRRPEDSNAALTSITETTTDQLASDPRVAIITNPNEPNIPTFPGTGNGTGSGTAAAMAPIDADEVEMEIAPNPLSIARRLREAGRGEPLIFKNYADGTDPVLGPGGGGGGITFNPRPPFRPPTLGPGGGFGGGGPVNPPNPVEVAPFFVTAMGWDHGMIGQRPIRSEDAGTTRRGFIDYVIDVPFDADETFIATLCWNRTVTVANPSFSPSNPQIGSLTQLELENLNLSLYPSYYATETYTIDPIAASQDTFSNVEHIVFNSNYPAFYVLRVEWVGTEYDLFNNLPNGNVEFAVSWRLDDMQYENIEFAVQELLKTPGRSLSAMLSSMGSSIESQNFDNRLDLNHDGRITGADLTVLLANWPNGNGRTF